MSQIATTIEQSKRLIAAGLDPESADMCYIEEIITDGIGCVPYRRTWSEYPCVDTHEGSEVPCEPVSFPAWSLSRLIDIHRNFDYGPMDDGSSAVIDCLVRAICNEIKYETGRVREEFIVKRPLGQPQETEGA